MLEKLKNLILDFADADADSIDENTELRSDLSLNSLDIVNIAVAIESEFNINIDENRLMKMRTVGEVAKYIEEKQG